MGPAASGRDGHAFDVEERGLRRGAPADPCVMVIFGAGGDLTRRELVPSLFELHRKQLLPERFAVVGCSHTEWDSATFRDEMRRAVEQSCGGTPDWEAFAQRLSFVRGDATSAPDEGYAALAKAIERVQSAFAIPRDLDRRLQEVFGEDQIYRIDHFLGKETVQNMFVFRFANPSFEPVTEVAIHFKPKPHLMFRGRGSRPSRTDVLVFEVQPNEGIVQTLAAKQPGPDLAMRTVTMNFRYAEAFGVEEPPRAYAWLLLDVMQGDQTLFARADWIDKAWQIVDPIVERWAAERPKDFPDYASGSAGPAAADHVMQRDGRRWRPP